MRLSVRVPRLAAFLGIAFGIVPLLGAQEDLPPEFLRAHALVVRFQASSFAVPGPGAGSSGSGAVGAASTPPSPTGPQPQGDTISTRPATAPVLPPAWTSSTRRYTVTGAPVAIRLSGDGIVVVVQITPYDRGKDGLLVVAQGQVWLRGDDGKISYHSAFESLNVAFGEPLYFFPLGFKPDGSAPLKVEIAIDRYGDPPSIPEPGAADSGKSTK